MDVKEIFEKAAVRYDRQRQKVFPHFNDFYQIIITLIPYYQEDNFRFLDLGAGKGLVADLILRAFPNSAADILNVSEKMLEKAKGRFAGNKRVRFRIRNYANDDLPDRYGLMVSAVSIGVYGNVCFADRF
jgi:tRNA (cmo5U34)-methyltransferase